MPPGSPDLLAGSWFGAGVITWSVSRNIDRSADFHDTSDWHLNDTKGIWALAVQDLKQEQVWERSSWAGGG